MASEPEESKTKGGELARALATGDVGALARAISAVEDGTAVVAQTLSGLPSPESPSPVIGVTGPPGAGKSTLIDALIAELRSQSRTVAIVGVDPSSAISGGAVLGDRVRMARHAEDDGVFIRSVSARGHLGGLCAAIEEIVRVIQASGRWDAIVLETVGAGQSEIEVARFADVTLVLTAPGMGDSVQALKSGILEIADVLVVNKADAPGADAAVRDLRSAPQRAGAGGRVEVLKTSAKTGEGVAELLSEIDRLLDRPA